MQLTETKLRKRNRCRSERKGGPEQNRPGTASPRARERRKPGSAAAATEKQGLARDTGRRELEAEQSQTSLILPLGEVGAHPGGGDAGSPETAMSRPKDGNTHASFDIAADRRVGLIPLLSE